MYKLGAIPRDSESQATYETLNDVFGPDDTFSSEEAIEAISEVHEVSSTTAQALFWRLTQAGGVLRIG